MQSRLGYIPALGGLRAVGRGVDRFITPSRLRGYPVVFIVMGLGVLALTLAHPPVTPDFLAHWTGGRMILDGNADALYDPKTQQAIQHGATSGGGFAWFVAPPFAAYLYVPFALFSYQVAAAMWTVFSIGCMVAAGWLVKPFAPNLFRDHAAVVYVALASTEAVFETLGSGQDAGLTVLLWVAGLRLLLSGRDFAGGAVLALGLMKPQLFFIVPFVLIAQRRWRALGGWAAMAAGLGVVSIQTVGVRGVVDWARLPFSDTFHSIAQVGQAWKMQSLPALTESTRILPKLGLAVAVVGLGVLLWQVWSQRDADQTGVWMLAIAGTVAISPHVLVYDLLVLLIPILWLLEHRNTRAVRLACLALFVLTWTVYARRVIGAPVDWAWSAIPVAALWALVGRAGSEVRRDDEVTRTPVATSA